MKKYLLIFGVIIFCLAAGFMSDHSFRLSPDEGTKQAVAKNDPSICTKIITSFSGGWDGDPKVACYYKVAQANLNTNACDYLSIKDSCYAKVGLGLRNINICEKLSDSIERQYCYSIYLNDAEKTEVTFDSSFCANRFASSTKLKDRCYSKIGGVFGDIKACYQVQNEDEKNNCFMYAAIATKNKSICTKIQNGSSPIAERKFCEDTVDSQ
jgi:hypothetical protein